MDQDLLRPQYESEKRKHKLKRLIQAPNSYFMDVKCPQCSTNNTVFSHARGIVTCIKCSSQLGRSTGGKLQLVLGAKYKTKMIVYLTVQQITHGHISIFALLFKNVVYTFNYIQVVAFQQM